MSFAVVPVATTSDPNTSRFPSRSTSPPNGGVMALMNLPDLCLAGGQHSIGISSPTQNTVFLDPTPSSLQYPASCRSQSCYIPTPATATMPATPKSGSSLNVHTEAKLEKSPCLFEIEESDDSEIANLATRTHSGLTVTTGLRSTASWLSGGPSTTALDSARRSAVLSSNDGRFSAPTIRRAPFTLTTSSSQHRGATPAIAKQLNFDSSANVSSRSQPAMDHTPEARVSSAGSTSGVAPANYSWAGAAMLIEA